ncbi:hypothetical protein A8C32_04555 [Flavivirga aquatica]|uniref:histidine kinase n=1 Tax=Flavivirga aquatica TaxID=1849968 RepID=A0A1E5SH94_9FLAO|nr:YfiR/HmsC family protein [Flavivirga aquatica]OEJ98489.1 hypothetical protein A8C32_04555 [Flavivirga aquatica]
MECRKTNVYTNIKKSIAIGLLCCFYCLYTYAQHTNNEQVKRLQRTILIYNFTQQITWENQENNERFRIGVLGPDRAIIDFKALVEKHKADNKPIEVIGFNLVEDIEDIQLLYVNNKYNFDINYILSEISGKNIFLVTEDYNYHTSMINIKNTGDSFVYEINNKNIEREGFVVLNSLKQYAINSPQKWENLYKTTEASSEKFKKEEAYQQKHKNNNPKIIVDTILNAVEIRDEWIKILSNESELQQKKFADKVKIERELEENIKQQIDFIKSQEEKIISSDLEIKKQLKYIENQTIEIEKKENILQEKESKINIYKTLNILLIVFICLLLLGALIIFKNYLVNKKLNKKLKIKNLEIEKQALELKSKNEELEQFAYIASHDLKEPLITITSLISLFVDDYKDKFDETGKMTLNFISESSVRMQKLIDAILQYSRLGKSKVYEDVNCNNTISTLKKDLRHVIERTNTKIISGDLPIVKGAKLELRLLFQNLISNGIKFTKVDTNPLIEINCIKKSISNGSNNDTVWEFSIKDNGIGIQEKHRVRIFSIFQRLHSREEYEGTGIGLAHCKKIVESHGGKIWLDSNEGEGTTFYFTIPA